MNCLLGIGLQSFWLMPWNPTSAKIYLVIWMPAKLDTAHSLLTTYKGAHTCLAARWSAEREEGRKLPTSPLPRAARKRFRRCGAMNADWLLLLPREPQPAGGQTFVYVTEIAEAALLALVRTNEIYKLSNQRRRNIMQNFLASFGAHRPMVVLIPGTMQASNWRRKG